MKDLFDMAAGTSTGSFISAGLGYSTDHDKNMPLYFGKELLELYTKQGGKILYQPEVDRSTIKITVFAVHVLIWGFVFYKIGKHVYDNDKVQEDFDKMHNIIENKKRRLKDTKSNKTGFNADMKNFVDNVKNKKTNMVSFMQSKLSKKPISVTNELELKESAGAIDISPGDLGGESAEHPLKDEIEFDENNKEENEKAIQEKL